MMKPQWIFWVAASAAIVVCARPGPVGAAVTSHDAALRVDELLQADLAPAADAKSSVAKSNSVKSGEAKSSEANASADKTGAGKWVEPKSAKATLAAGAKPVRQANDEIFLRRALMDLIGEPPTPAQITAFVLDPSTDKRAVLVDRLLAKSQFGDNWARYWRDVIMYRKSDDRA